MNKQTYVIVSRDRHRDDKVYIVNCEKGELRDNLLKVWDKDFSFKEADFYGEWVILCDDYVVEAHVPINL